MPEPLRIDCTAPVYQRSFYDSTTLGGTCAVTGYLDYDY